jgi:hypothetical protein
MRQSLSAAVQPSSLANTKGARFLFREQASFVCSGVECAISLFRHKFFGTFHCDIFVEMVKK